jgi:hypothetical protein
MTSGTGRDPGDDLLQAGRLRVDNPGRAIVPVTRAELGLERLCNPQYPSSS